MEGLLIGNEAPAVSSPANNTLGMLLGGALDIFKTREARKLADATRSTPTGQAAPNNPNPIFGNWSPFPQNDTKEQYQNATPFSFGSINPMVWIALFGLGFLLVFARR